MASFYWKYIRESSHPCWTENGFVCQCGHHEKTILKIEKHIFDNHSQEFAYENMSAKGYNKLYKTAEYKAKLELSRKRRQLAKFIANEGFKKTVFKGIYHKNGDIFGIHKLKQIYPDKDFSVLN